MESDPKNTLRSILYFDSMLMPKLITFIYWLMIFTAVISALGLLAAGNVVGGLLAAPFGLLGARLWCELMIVLFKINENLQKIADRTL